MIDVNKYDLRIVPLDDIALSESYDIGELKSKINSYRIAIAVLVFVIVGGAVYISYDQQARNRRY